MAGKTAFLDGDSERISTFARNDVTDNVTDVTDDVTDNERL
jgi:hypothetical protein